MEDKKRNFDNEQQRKNKSTGEHRNGRLSQFKNNDVHHEENPNEYINKQSHEN